MKDSYKHLLFHVRTVFKINNTMNVKSQVTGKIVTNYSSS